MSVRKPPADGISTRQKLTLFHGTALTAEAALSTPDDQITFEMMLSNGVKALNIVTAGIRPMTMKQHGVTTASQMRRLGFDALHLVDSNLCTEANAAFGAADVVAAFLVSPQDAVALAGSDATKTLNISVQQLLEVCAGAPTEAVSVLQQVTDEKPLQGVSASVLLDTGLRAAQLKQLGYNIASLGQLAGADGNALAKLGFTL